MESDGDGNNLLRQGAPPTKKTSYQLQSKELRRLASKDSVFQLLVGYTARVNANDFIKAHSAFVLAKLTTVLTTQAKLKIGALTTLKSGNSLSSSSRK